jgi:hypothetical protein
MDQPMERRTFLRAGSLGMAALVAGCNSSSSGGANNSTAESGGNSTGTAAGTPTDTSAEEPATTQSGPAQFSDVAIQGPTNVTAGEEFTLPVSVANTGGENGTFSDTLTVAEGSASFNRSVTIEGVQPGATANTSVGPLNISSTDTYTLAIEGTNTTHEIQVNPVEKQPGGTVTADNLRISVQGISLAPALFYAVDTGYGTDGTGTGLLSAGSGNILCVIRVALENVGTNQAEFTIPQLYNPDSGGAFAESSGSPPTMLTLPNGTFYTELPGSGGDLGQIQGIDGNPLTNVQLNAGQSQSGWLVAQLPRTAASGAVRVGYQGDSKGSPPEAVWPFAPQSGSTRALPKFSLDSFDVPSTAQLGSSNSYTIRVTNTGNGPGTYRSITQFKRPDDRDWSSYNRQQARIGPGQSTTFEQPIAYPSDPTLGEAQFRLRPFGQTAAVTFDTTQLSFGSTFTGPLGRNITVSDVQQADSYQLSDQDEPVTPQQSQHFILARLGVNFVEQDAQNLLTSNFDLVSGGSTYGPTSVYAARYTSPVQADVLRGSLEGPKGSSQSGYIIYSVPQSVTPSNAKIVWSADNPWARWQSGQ